MHTSTGRDFISIGSCEYIILMELPHIICLYILSLATNDPQSSLLPAADSLDLGDIRKPQLPVVILKGGKGKGGTVARDKQHGADAALPQLTMRGTDK